MCQVLVAGLMCWDNQNWRYRAIEMIAVMMGMWTLMVQLCMASGRSLCLAA